MSGGRQTEVISVNAMSREKYNQIQAWVWQAILLSKTTNSHWGQ